MVVASRTSSGMVESAQEVSHWYRACSARARSGSGRSVDQSQVSSGDPGAGELFIGGVAGSQPSEQLCPGARGVVVGGAA
jgi:hypothetical protein